MNFRDVTPPGQSELLRFEAELPHAPAKVWRALTEPALVSRWLLPVLTLPTEVGAEFRLQAPPQPGWDGVVDCTLLEHEAPSRLRYRWAVGGMALVTVVSFTVEATEGGTRLTIEQSGFTAAQRQNFGGARYGWAFMGGRLVELLAEEGAR